MALITCHECGGKVSTEAKSCPVCGAAPKRPQSLIVKVGGAFIGACVVLVAIGFFGALFGQSEEPPPPKAQPAAAVAPAAATPVAPTCEASDLRCLAKEGIIAASVRCPRAVEGLAKHSVKWKDGFLEAKFDRFRWKDQPNGVITYIGGKAEFQNGFGAFTPVIYECDLAPDNRTILDVRVREGRLAN